MSDQYSKFLRRNKRLIEKIYVHQIAKTIADKSRPKIRPEWFPNIPNPPAMRMAIEFVSDWLADKKMDLTLEIAKLESNSLVGVDRHQAGYIERNLQLEVFEPIIPQLVNIKNANKAAERDLPEKKPKRADALELVQSSDSSEFSEQSIMDEALAKRQEMIEHNKRKHRHHSSKSKPKLDEKARDLAVRKADKIAAEIKLNEFDTFTESSDSAADIWDPNYGLDKEKRNALEQKKQEAAERKELRRLQELERDRKKKAQKKREEDASYSYSTYGTGYSYGTYGSYSTYGTDSQYSYSTQGSNNSSRSHRHSHGHHHRHHRHSTRSDYSYSSYQTPDYSYTYGSNGSYSTYSNSASPSQQAPSTTHRRTVTQSTAQSATHSATQSATQSAAPSFTSPHNTTLQLPPRPPTDASYTSGYTDIDTRGTAQGSEYSYTYYTTNPSGSYYSQSYETQTKSKHSGTGRKTDMSWSTLEKNYDSSLKVGPSPFKDRIEKQPSDAAPLYQAPPQKPEMRRQPPVQQPVRAGDGEPDYLKRYQDGGSTADSSSKALRKYSKPATKQTASDNYFGSGVIVHQTNIVTEEDVYE